MKKRSLAALCLSVLACHSYAAAQKAGDESQAMERIRALAKMQMIWGNPASQPVAGSHLDVVQVRSETSSDGHLKLHVNFKVTGLPIDAQYTLEYWPIGSPSPPFQTVASHLVINKDGLIVCGPDLPCGDKTKAEYPLEILIPQVAQGESLRFVLTSEKDRKILLTGLTVPFPNMASDNGCSLSVVRLTREGEILQLSGSGFPPNQDITLTGDSAGEAHHEIRHTDAQGHFVSTELPFVTGKDAGILHVEVSEGVPCHPAISTPWGKGSYVLQ